MGPGGDRSPEPLLVAGGVGAFLQAPPPSETPRWILEQSELHQGTCGPARRFPVQTP